MENYNAFESSNIASLKYYAETLTLQVSFHNGSDYQYFDIPQHIWEAFKLAESKGAFLNAEIKGTYRYSKV